MNDAAAQNDEVMNNKEKKGTYADVFLGRQLSTGRKIAIKKIKIGQFPDGLDMSAIREVKFLQELRHANIVENLNLVLEFLDTDLELVIKDRSLVFQAGDIKSWMLMTIKGLDFCHRNFVLHRDLKPNNLLIAADGTLKLADFGLAREYADPNVKMSTQVVTRWYRPPELLMGARFYAGNVDIWAAGCIFAELLLRTPYLPGESDIQQLELIFKALGTPTEEDWPARRTTSSTDLCRATRSCQPTCRSLDNRVRLSPSSSAPPRLTRWRFSVRCSPSTRCVGRLHAERCIIRTSFSIRGQSILRDCPSRQLS